MAKPSVDRVPPPARADTERVRLPSRRALLWGIQIFILVSLGGLALGSRRTGLDLQVAGSFDWRFALAIPFLVALDYLLGGWRYRVLFNGRVMTHVSLWDCLRSNWGNIFLGAATPFQTGGGPAQIYLLWRAGARMSESLLASLVNFAGTLVFFCFASWAALLLIPSGLFDAAVMNLIRSAFVVVGVIAALTLAVVACPHASLAVVRWVNDRLLGRIPWLRGMRARLLARFAAGVDRFSGSVRLVWSRGTRELIWVVLLTLVLFWNKFSIGYAVVRALGVSAPYGIFLGLSSIQLFVIYFAPTPGASGVAELSSVWLMARILPKEILLLYTILWRFLTTVLGAVIGGIVLFLEVRRQAREEGKRPALETGME